MVGYKKRAGFLLESFELSLKVSMIGNDVLGDGLGMWNTKHI